MASPNTAASAPAGGEEVTFFSLPPEIRLAIYELIIPSGGPAIRRSSKAPALLAVCILIRNEAAKVYYRTLRRASKEAARSVQWWQGRHVEAMRDRKLSDDHMAFYVHTIIVEMEKQEVLRKRFLRAATKLTREGFPVKNW